MKIEIKIKIINAIMSLLSYSCFEYFKVILQ